MNRLAHRQPPALQAGAARSSATSSGDVAMLADFSHGFLASDPTHEVGGPAGLRRLASTLIAHTDLEPDQRVDVDADTMAALLTALSPYLLRGGDELATVRTLHQLARTRPQLRLAAAGTAPSAPASTLPGSLLPLWPGVDRQHLALSGVAGVRVIIPEGRTLATIRHRPDQHPLIDLLTSRRADLIAYLARYRLVHIVLPADVAAGAAVTDLTAAIRRAEPAIRITVDPTAYPGAVRELNTLAACGDAIVFRREPDSDDIAAPRDGNHEPEQVAIVPVTNGTRVRRLTRGGRFPRLYPDPGAGSTVRADSSTVVAAVLAELSRDTSGLPATWNKIRGAARRTAP
ncbi:hypothetical protein [Asanoa siamensis]|nr:hypothetical protein [Asanoa siamensis]